jgi:methyl-accepting chemotaxis protein
LATVSAPIMTIPVQLQKRFDFYAIDAEVDAARAEIWELLEPILDPALRELGSSTKKIAPARTKGFKGGTSVWIGYLKKLFCEPLDERCLADAHARMQAELSMGQDVRNRGVQMRAFLSKFFQATARRYRFNPLRAARLNDMATRIFLFDMANAVSCYNRHDFESSQARGDALDAAISEFDRTIAGVRQAIGGVITSLGETSNHLTALAAGASGEADKTAEAAADTAENVEKTAAATEELSASIAEVHGQAMRSAGIAHGAVSGAERTNATMRSLHEAVEKIGSVVGLISDIASQTNLLALNATIEAARAGEAGRGFAVVASEVKALATQTSKATDEIGRQIGVIQEATRRSVEEIAGAGRTIADIAAIAEAVAGSVDQQAAATASIAESATSAAANATTVAEALDSVGETIRRTQEAAKAVLEFSRALEGRTGELDNAMNTLFKTAAGRTGVRQLAQLE